MSKGNAVGWFEIYVDDMARARKFYENVFETQLSELKSPVPDLEMWAFGGDMTKYGAPGALAKMKGLKAGANSVLIYFSSADCAIQEKRVKEFGGRIDQSKRSIGEYGFITLAFDTENNLFGIHSLK